MSDTDVEIKFGADASGVQAGASEAKAEVTGLAAAIQQMAQSTRQQTAVMAQGFSQLTDQLNAASAAARSAGSGVSSGMRTASQAMTQAAHSSTGLRRELIIMAHEAATGRFSRLGGSVLVLAERWEALGAVLANPVTWGFAAVAAAAAGVVAVFVQANAEAAKLNNTLQLTGNYAGVTASQFQDMASKLGDQMTVGVGKARSVLEELIATGRFTGQEVQQLGTDTTEFSRLSGENTEKVVEGWVKLADAPSRYADEFNRTYHAFSAAQLQHIAELEREGDKEGAVAAAVQDLTQWINRQSVAVDGITGRFQVWGKVLGDVADKFALFIHARSATNSEQLAQINQQIADAQRLGQTEEGRRSLVGTHGDFDAYLAKLEQQKTLIEGVEAVDQAYTQAQADHNRVQQAGTDAYERSHQTLLSLKSSAQQAAIAVKALHDEMAARLAANPGDTEAQDYFAHEAKYDNALRRRIDRADYKRPKAPQSRVGDWETQFQETEVQNSNDLGGVVFNKDQDAAAYWQTILDTETLSAKEREEVERKLAEAKNALLRQNAQASTEAAREQVQDAEIAAEETLYQQKEAIQAQIAAVEDAGKQGLISRQEVDARVKALLDQQVAYEQEAAQKILQARLALDAATMAQYAPGTTEYQKALNDKLAAEVAFEKAVSTSQVSADKQYQGLLLAQQNAAVANFERMATRIGDYWRTTTEGLIQGTMTWQSAFNRIVDGVLDAFLQMAEKQLVHWVAAEVAKTGITNAQTAIRKAIELVTGAQAVATAAATNTALVNSNAAVAGAAAAAAVAGIPIIGPELAVTQGAATYAEVLGMFGPMASAAGGWGQIPRDQIAQVHKDEMVLPASIASPLRSIISSYHAPSANLASAAAAPLSAVTPFSPGGAPAGGGTWNVQANDAKSFKRMLEENGDHITRLVAKRTRHNRAAYA